MIPLQEQERLRGYFLEQLTGGVKLEHFTLRPLAIVVPGRDDCRFCAETRQLLTELRALSPKINLRVQELDDSARPGGRLGIERAPTTVLRGQLNRPVRFEGFFGGLLFPMLVDTIASASRGSTNLDARSKRRLERIRDHVDLRVLVAPSSPYAAAMMQTAFALGLENQRLKVTVTEVDEFPRLVETYQLRAVPMTIIGDRTRFIGDMSTDELLDRIIHAAEQRTTRLTEALLGAPVGPSTPLQGASEVRASPSGLILPGR